VVHQHQMSFAIHEHSQITQQSHDTYRGLIAVLACVSELMLCSKQNTVRKVATQDCCVDECIWKAGLLL